MIDYFAHFPFPPALIPLRLRELLEPIRKDSWARLG
jgi:hypothetical protein